MPQMAASQELPHSDALSEMHRLADDDGRGLQRHAIDGFVGRQGTAIRSYPTESVVNTKDAGKKKRVNRAAKLKQCKLDVRREQWLAQGKPIKSEQLQTQIANPVKDQCSHCPGRLENNCNDGFSSLITYDMGKRQTDVTAEGKKSRAANEKGSPIISPKEEFLPHLQFLDTRTGETNLGLSVINTPTPGSEDKEQKAGNTDPAVEKPQERVPGCDYSRRSSTDMTVSLSRSSSSFETSRSGSSLSGSSCTGSGSDGDDDNQDAEDDWETAADALHVQVSPQHKHYPCNDQSAESSLKSSDPSVKRSLCLFSSDLQNGALKPQYKYKSGPFGNRIRGNGGRAWRPDDVSRPPTLPRLSKQLSFPLQPGIPAWSSVHGSMWGSSPAPSYCPICTEELDVTDSSFLPCVCGFRLCLFCHHKISSEDGRCPGCRKLYSSDVATKLSRSSTMRLRI